MGVPMRYGGTVTIVPENLGHRVWGEEKIDSLCRRKKMFKRMFVKAFDKLWV